MGRQVRRGRGQWEKIIYSQSQSGLSAKAYCKQESIGLASFYQWRKRIGVGPERSSNSSDQKGEFIEMGKFEGLHSELTADKGGLTITVDLGDGLSLTVRRG